MNYSNVATKFVEWNIGQSAPFLYASRDLLFVLKFNYKKNSIK